MVPPLHSPILSYPRPSFWGLGSPRLQFSPHHSASVPAVFCQNILLRITAVLEKEGWWLWAIVTLKFGVQPVLRGQGPCSLVCFLLVCEGTGRSPQAGQLRHVVSVCLSRSADHCVSAYFLLCGALCVYVSGFVALCLSVSFCTCVWVPGCV